MPKFEVDLKQLVRNLGEFLYSTPDAAIRELIQNAHDAIASRFGDEASTKGVIEIVVDERAHTLRVTDNGSGMTAEGLAKHLSTLGQGVKKVKRGSAREKPIGQYGIGFFSAFMIARRITVHTRAGGEEPALKWESVGVEGYEVECTGLVDQAQGTSVAVELDRGSSRYADPSNITSIVRKYCNYLACRILVNGEAVNARKFPWERPLQGREAGVLAHFGEPLLLFETGSRRVDGVRYEYMLACGRGGEGLQQLYCMRMFVTGELLFLSERFRFLKLAINCDGLKLALSREKVVEDNKTYRAVVADCESLAAEVLRAAMKRRPVSPELMAVLRARQPAMRHLATTPEGLREAESYLLFPLAFPVKGTSGSISVGQYLAVSPSADEKILLWMWGKDAARKSRGGGLLLRVCEERGLPVVCVDDEEENELLRRVCNHLGVIKRPLEEHPILEDDGAVVEAVYERLRTALEHYLGVPVRISNFMPRSLPLAIRGETVVVNSGSRAMHDLSSLSLGAGRQRQIYTSIHKILTGLDRAGIAPAEMERIVEGVMSMANAWGKNEEECERVKQALQSLSYRWWDGPTQLRRVLEGTADGPGGRKPLKCFLAAPFAAGHRDALNVCKQVCEEFGVAADAADAIDTIGVLQKVCQYIDKADFAIVDITEARPNVMLELGLLMARRKPAIIIRAVGRQRDADAYVPTDIIGIERIEYENTTEDLRRKLTDIFRRRRMESAHAAADGGAS